MSGLTFTLSEVTFFLQDNPFGLKKNHIQAFKDIHIYVHLYVYMNKYI